MAVSYDRRSRRSQTALALPAVPLTLNSAQTDSVLLGMSSWPSFRTLGLGLDNEYSC